MNHNARGFINTNDILNYLVPKRSVVEKPEFNITERHNNIVRGDNENNKGEEGSIRELETNNNQATGSRSYEAKIIDDPKQGGKIGNILQTEVDVESTNETYIGNAWNGHVSSKKADIINDDKDHEKECEHQITGGLKETDNEIEPVKTIMAEITLEQKDNNTERSQIQWNAVEVWETNAKSK